MDIVLLLIIAFFALLTMLTIFSLIMILTALNQNKPKIKKAKKAKKAKKSKERRKSRQSEIIDTDDDTSEHYIIPNSSNNIPTSQDTRSSISAMDMSEEDVIDFCEIPEFSTNPMDEPVQPENKLTKFMHGLKQRVTQAQTDAQARAIQREEMRIQEEIELGDMWETLEEAPEDFSGKLKYWWRNNFAFRIGICITAVLLVCIMIFYSFQVRSKAPLDVAQNAITTKDKDADNKTDENETKQKTEQDSTSDDLFMAEFRKKLGDELAPIDIKADSLEPLPNMAEIIETVQQNTGRTTATYPGSNTTQQPTGSIATISIPSINLKNAPVMGSVELSDLSKGTGHFENTPVFDGNVGIAGHNNTHFKYLANVEIGNQIQYTVNGVTRTYEVTDMRAISDNDWGVFTDHGDNRLTLITCEHAVPDRRIAVTAVQVGSDQGTATATHQRPSTTRNNVKSNSTQHKDSGDYHDAGGGYTDYIGTFTGVN